MIDLAYQLGDVSCFTIDYSKEFKPEFVTGIDNVKRNILAVCKVADRVARGDFQDFTCKNITNLVLEAIVNDITYFNGTNLRPFLRIIKNTAAKPTNTALKYLKKYCTQAFEQILRNSSDIITTAEEGEVSIPGVVKKALNKKGKNVFLLQNAVQRGKNDAKNSEKVVEKIILVAHNIKQFFSLPFGQEIKNICTWTNYEYDGKKIYRMLKDYSKDLQKGDLFYLDAMHYDHIEVFTCKGKIRSVLNLDGTLNSDKFKRALGRSLDL